MCRLGLGGEGEDEFAEEVEGVHGSELDVALAVKAEVQFLRNDLFFVANSNPHQANGFIFGAAIGAHDA